MCGMVAQAATRGRAVATLAVALGAAQGAARLLRRREGITPRAPVRVEEHFTAEELARARAFRRPQRLLGLAAGAFELALLGALAARPPRALRGARPAAAGAALSLAGALVPLPVRAIARRRAIRG